LEADVSRINSFSRRRNDIESWFLYCGVASQSPVLIMHVDVSIVVPSMVRK